MGRIRTIKPEFPQSESIGRLSRDARLLFIQLWTIADDSGRARASSRMLASLLYPCDDDAVALMPQWLIELEKHGHIQCYEVEGKSYLFIVKWHEHQKIDRPSPSKLPAPREASTNARQVLVEGSSTDLDLDQGKDLGNGKGPGSGPGGDRDREPGPGPGPDLETTRARTHKNHDQQSPRSLATALPTGALARSAQSEQAEKVEALRKKNPDELTLTEINFLRGWAK